MQRKLLLLLLAVLAPLLVWLLFFWQPDGGDAGDGHGLLNLSLAPEGGDFVMQSADGPIDLADYRGQVVLLYFGYTMCPDICPTNLALVTYALGKLTPAERGQVKVIFISVDPERDNLQRLKEYGAYFSDRMVGVTGTREEIDRAAKRYGAAYRIVDDGSEAGYLVDHTAFTYVIGKQGKLQTSLPHATPPDRILEVIRENLYPSRTGVSDGERPLVVPGQGATTRNSRLLQGVATQSRDMQRVLYAGKTCS